MKSLSASIVVLAASIMITGGAFVPHDDTAMFVQVVGCLVGMIGMGTWFVAFNRRDEK